MRVRQRCLLAVAAFLLHLPSLASGDRLLYSNSLNSCQQNSGLVADAFDVVFTPNNGSAAIQLDAISTINTHVNFTIVVVAYGLEIIRKVIDPCALSLGGLCPMTPSRLPDAPFNVDVDKNAVSLPGVAYTIPDLDVTVRAYINDSKTGISLACVEATVSNGKTVDLLGVKWATAVVAGLALVSSGIINAIGHHNTAAHIAANSLALLSYFQSQITVGWTGVHLPPIAAAWVQNFQWSMGIIRLGFMQSILTWYQRATGGAPATLFDPTRTQSVQVQKRSLTALDADDAMNIVKRDSIVVGSGKYLVYGIQRVAYRAGIESTNLFLTGLVFFIIFMLLAMLLVAACKGVYKLLVSRKLISPDRYSDFNLGWVFIVKGVVYRMCILGFTPICTLCLWEFTQRDSPAEVVLAALFLVSILGMLGKAIVKVILIANQSVTRHQNPAFILFSDTQILNKLGFLYIQFRASAYYFIVPALVYAFIKAMLVAVAQSNPVAQAVGFVVIELIAIVGASVMRPWMDKPTNSFSIAILVVNLLNAVCLLIFSDVFGAPALAIGVVGVVFFILNAAFSLILLLMVIVSTTVCFFRKNPDARYQFMGDDRVSFMKSQTQLNRSSELDLLAVTARGDHGASPTHDRAIKSDDISRS